MAKKKIALFCIGWASELLKDFCKGLSKGLREYNADLYVFMSYPLMTFEHEFILGENNIFSLPDVSMFDAVLVLGNLFEDEALYNDIVGRCKQSNVTCISVAREHKDAYYIGCDNKAGIEVLLRHLLDVHHMKNPFYMGGNYGNKDSNERFESLRNMMREYGLPFDADSNCFTTEWSPRKAGEKAVELMRDESRTVKPDIFVCANDVLAQGVISALENAGIKVPEDVCVTGYDNDYTTYLSHPSVTSYNQRFDRLGYQSIKSAMDIIEGKKVEKVQLLEGELALGESCGCKYDNSELIKQAFKDLLSEKKAYSYFEKALEATERAVLKGVDCQSLFENIKQVYDLAKKDIFGNSFYLVLNPLFEDAMKTLDVNLATPGYGEYMNLAFAVDNGEFFSDSQIETRYIIPVKSSDKNRIFVMVPIHEDADNYGYMAFGDDLDIICSTDRLTLFCNRLSAALAKFKQNSILLKLNARLTEIMETDPLTGIKSRNAFAAKEKIINSSLTTTYSKFAIAMFDVNNLKIVNDELGHESGDAYLKSNCMAICRIFKHSPVYRIGGDEFLAILTDQDFDDRDMLFEDLQMLMEERDAIGIPKVERISVACGIAAYDASVDSDVAHVIARADELMYQNKAFMKGREYIR